MNAKISVFVICAEAIIYLLYNLHDCTFKIHPWQVFYLVMYIFQINHIRCSNIPHLLQRKKTRLRLRYH